MDIENFVTPTWQEYRQIQQDITLFNPFQHLEAQLAERREREQRFLALFTAPKP